MFRTARLSGRGDVDMSGHATVGWRRLSTIGELVRSRRRRSPTRRQLSRRAVEDPNRPEEGESLHPHDRAARHAPICGSVVGLRPDQSEAGELDAYPGGHDYLHGPEQRDGADRELAFSEEGSPQVDPRRSANGDTGESCWHPPSRPPTIRTQDGDHPPDVVVNAPLFLSEFRQVPDELVQIVSINGPQCVVGPQAELVKSQRAGGTVLLQSLQDHRPIGIGCPLCRHWGARFVHRHAVQSVSGVTLARPSRQSRREPVEVAGKQGDLPDVRGPGQPGHPAFESYREPAVRR